MKNKNITSVLGVIGLAGLASVCTLSAQQGSTPAPAAPPAAPQAIPPAPTLTDAEVKTLSSYVLGLQSAQRFAGSGLSKGDMESESFMKGFFAGLKGDQPEYSEDKLRAAMTKLGEAVQAREAQKSAKNLAAGNAFLAENGKRKGVTTTSTGLQYEVIKKGSEQKYVAPPSGAQDTGTTFLVHYKGTLIDGTEFDSSIKHNPDGTPSEFPINRIAPGFREALTTMPVGAKWKIYLPAALGYGDNPRGPGGANSALIFEVELVEIKAAPPAPVAPPAAPPVPRPARPKASAVTPPVQVPAPAPAKKAEKAE